MARIFICDDDDIYAAMLMEFLRRRGHNPIHATDVNELRIMLEAGAPDLVILDMQVGGGGGPSAVSIAMARVPIIICSGMPVEQQRKWFSAVPNIRFLQKPLDLSALERTLTELLG